MSSVTRRWQPIIHLADSDQSSLLVECIPRFAAPYINACACCDGAGCSALSVKQHYCALQGPREDSGFLSDVNPGVRMAARMYNYCQKYHPKTKVMVSGLRKAEGATLTHESCCFNFLSIKTECMTHTRQCENPVGEKGLPQGYAQCIYYTCSQRDACNIASHVSSAVMT